MDEAIAGGVNLIDTAEDHFESEVRVGKALEATGKPPPGVFVDEGLQGAFAC